MLNLIFLNIILIFNAGSAWPANTNCNFTQLTNSFIPLLFFLVAHSHPSNPNNNILESNVLSSPWGLVSEIFNNFNNFLITLNAEQHACLVNGLGFFLIFITLNTLVSIYFGDKLITYLKLDTRFPSIAKIIEYRRKFRNFYFIFNVIFMYFCIIFFIAADIFFFFRSAM